MCVAVLGIDNAVRADEAGPGYSDERNGRVDRVIGEGVSEDLPLCRDLGEGSVSGNQPRQRKSKCKGRWPGHV